MAGIHDVAGIVDRISEEILIRADEIDESDNDIVTKNIKDAIPQRVLMNNSRRIENSNCKIDFDLY